MFNNFIVRNLYKNYFTIDYTFIEDEQLICPKCHVDIIDFDIYESKFDFFFVFDCWFCNESIRTMNFCIVDLHDNFRDFEEQALAVYNKNQDKIIKVD